MKYLKRFIETTAFDLSQLTAEQQEDIGFKFKSKKVPLKPGVISHEIITIDIFNTPDGFENIQFQPFHLIFGESSLAIFDAFDVQETAGLKRRDAQNFIEDLKSKDKTERDGAFIAGLTNWSGKELYMFFNLERMSSSIDYVNRVIPHESLHLTRALISISANEWLKKNQGQKDWYLDPQSAFEKLEDENEEYFTESLERITSITYSKYEKCKYKDKESELKALRQQREQIQKRIEQLEKELK